MANMHYMDEHYFQAFYAACEDGHLEILEWIIEHTMGTKETPKKYNEHEILNDQINRALAVACEFGHLHIAKWLESTFTIKDAGDAMCEACASGHLDIAKWIKDTLPIDWFEIGIHSFNTACENGRLDVAKWLAEFTELDDLLIPLESACKEGHLDVAKWLVETFDETEVTEIFKKPHYLILRACQSGHLDVFRWLLQQTCRQI